MQRAVFEYTEATECCANCKHFHEHYIKNSESSYVYTAIWQGHCVNGRIKTRKVTDLCEKFEWREIDGSED